MVHFEFQHAAVAGTFDHFHAGHKALLQKAFASAQFVSVGITDQSMTEQKLLPDVIEPFADRRKQVESFLLEQQLTNRYKIFTLHDMYGPATNEPTLEALVVSSKTVEGGKLVNVKREAAGLPALALIVADYVPSDDDSYLSSTRIRAGEINRLGVAYTKFLLLHAPFTMSLAMRSELTQPLGRLLAGREDDMTIAVKKAKDLCKSAEMVYTVGDIVTETFRANGVPIDLAVFDYRNKRKNTADKELHNPDKHNWFMVTNDAGTISRSAIEGLLKIHSIMLHPKAKKQMYDLLVGGEEDLLVLPIILVAPLKSVVFYGQSSQGVVAVSVTEAEKLKTWHFLQQTIL